MSKISQACSVLYIRLRVTATRCRSAILCESVCVYLGFCNLTCPLLSFIYSIYTANWIYQMSYLNDFDALTYLEFTLWLNTQSKYYCILSTEIEVIEQCYTYLAEAISSDLSYYSGQFIECNFIAQATAQLICEALGKDEKEKAVALLDDIIHYFKVDEHRKDAFEKFVNIFSRSEKHSNLAHTMRENYGKLLWICIQTKISTIFNC